MMEGILRKCEWGLMALFCVALCIHWSWAVWVINAMGLFLVAKLVLTRQVGNRALGRWGYWGLVLPVAYFALYAVSYLYSDNKQEAATELVKLLPFLVLPLYFMLSDTSYMTSRHVRALMYLFSAALTMRFVVRCVVSAHGLYDGSGEPFVMGRDFDTIHHMYVAVYPLLVVAFVYGELLYHRASLPRWVVVGLVVMVPMMLFYTYVVQSRAGILCMVALLGALLLHLTFATSHRRLGIALMMSAVAVSVVGILMMPKMKGMNRLNETVVKLAEGDYSGDRFDLWHNDLITIGQHLPFGAGLGDRIEAMRVNFPEDSWMTRYPRPLNAHNQYLDTLVTTGIPGGLVLLAMVLYPGILWLCRRREGVCFRYWLPLALVIAISCLFESFFERQIGILFFLFFYCLFCIPIGSIKH